MKSTVIIYDSKNQMEVGIKQMATAGWNVESVTVLPASYQFGKTCLLGIIFLPLALLGKGSDKYSVKFVSDNPSADILAKPIVSDGSDDFIKFMIIVIGVFATFYVVSELFTFLFG